MSLKTLDEIDTIEDLRNLSIKDLPELANDLREFIITSVSEKGGHLGSSLGVVELTIALHYIYHTPKDLLVWDVGHQAYVHKILTGRKERFHSNRRLNGISGFPEMTESNFDAFGVGHSSTSISAVLGMALASKIKNEISKEHIAVIGDASIASGLAFEGLNHAGVSNSNILIVLNDNSIGIDPSVGALKEHLLKNSNDNNFFRSLNLNYFGPIDGHNISLLISELKKLKKIEGPKLLHVITKKGKGLKEAENNQVVYHSPGRFDKLTGKLLKQDKSLFTKFQDVFGKTLLDLAMRNKKIVGITPAMSTGSSISIMMNKIPNRVFDVGIAEQHAVTLAAGMATQGLIPFCNIYSTFLQRAYDQVIHDVAIQKLPVIFCLDRAGLVGEDGATHHGVFDIAFLKCIPNLIIVAPSNEVELRNIMYTAQNKLNKPIAIRYPRGKGLIKNWEKKYEEIQIGKGIQVKKGEKISVLCIGSIIENVKDATKNMNVSIYDMRFVKPLDERLLIQIFDKGEKIITVEDGVISGGFGSAILEFMSKNNYNNKIKTLGIPDMFIKHGTIHELQESIGLDKNSIREIIEDF